MAFNSPVGELRISSASRRLGASECEGCIVHFFDTSKKGSRRSCSMNICGNKLKVAAYQRSLRLLSRVSARHCIPISSPYYRKGTPGMVKSMQRERGLPRLTASVPVAQAQCQLALHGPMPDAVMASVHNRMP